MLNLTTETLSLNLFRFILFSTHFFSLHLMIDYKLLMENQYFSNQKFLLIIIKFTYYFI